MKYTLFRHLPLILLLLLFTGHQPAFGQAFEKGYDALKARQYKKAKKYLTMGIRKSRDKFDKALMYKLLGIAEYSLGRKSAAASNFKRAIRIDPSLRINRDETRNRGIVSLYGKIKKKMKRRRGGSRMSSRRSRSSRQSFRRDRRQRSSVARQSRKPDTGFVTNILPLSIAQFKQGRGLKGAILATGQVAGIGLALERSIAASSEDKRALDIITEQDASSAFTQTEFDAYLDQSEAFVLQARQESLAGYGLFGVFYLYSVYDAMSYKPPAPRSRRRRGSLDLDQYGLKLAAGEELESIYLAPKSYQPQGFQFKILPYKTNPTVLVSWSKGF